MDSWYANKAVWRAARQHNRDFAGGLKSNRQIRETLPDDQRVWLKVADYAASRAADDFQPVLWPNQDGGQRV